jgi:hypothetical protein
MCPALLLSLQIFQYISFLRTTKTRNRQCVRRTNTKPLPVPLHTKCPQYEKILTRRIAECRIAIHIGQGNKSYHCTVGSHFIWKKGWLFKGGKKEAAGQVIFSFLRHLLYTAPPLPATTQGQIGGRLVSGAEQKNKVKKSRIYVRIPAVLCDPTGPCYER